MVAGGCFFAVMGSFVKWAAATESHVAVVFWRNFFGLLAYVPWILWRRPPLRTAHIGLHFVRSLIGLGAMYCFFFGLLSLPLAEAVLLSYSAPVFIPLLALVWLQEPFRPSTALAIGLGFAGVFIVLRPGFVTVSAGHLVGLAAGALAAAAMVAIRRMSRTEPSERIVFYYCVICTGTSAVPMLLWGSWPAATAWWPLLGSGVLATLGQVCLTQAYSLGEAGRMGPWQYTTVVFAALIGFVYWGEPLSVYTFLGALLVAAAGYVLTRTRPR